MLQQAQYSERQIAAARGKRHILKDAKRLRELIADLPFNKIIGLHELWEAQQRELSAPTHRTRVVVGLSKKRIGR